MKPNEARPFTSGGHQYIDTLIAGDVHQISDPATGVIYGAISEIRPDGRSKGYWLAGFGRVRCASWEAAVASVRGQYFEHNSTTPVPAPEPEPEPAPVVAVVTPAPEPALDTKGWILTRQRAADAWGVPVTTIHDWIHSGQIRAIRDTTQRRNRNGYPWLVEPPPAPVAPRPLPKPRKARPTATTPALVAAAEAPSTSEPTITIRPALTRTRELEAQLQDTTARLQAVEAQLQALSAPRPSWLTRLFGGR